MSNLSNQRPFFYSFLAAFRAQSAHTKSAASVSSQSTSASTFSSSANSHPQSQISSPSSLPPSTTHSQLGAAATARAIGSKQPHQSQSPSFAVAAASAFSPPSHHPQNQHHPRHHHHHHHTQARHTARSPLPASSLSPGPGATTFGGRTRRSSDSSSDNGFSDATTMGGEKWFIGGRTGQGDERFYQLSMVRRERSGDRASCDRMSL